MRRSRGGKGLQAEQITLTFIVMSGSKKRVVIVGGGFGGLEAALGLESSSLDVTLVDRRNYHLFQPLLYQVATGGLSPGDISSPMRSVLKRARNITVLMGDVVDLSVDPRRIILRDGEIEYDQLVVSTGAHHHYFGNQGWERDAPGLKTVEDALEIRRRILRAFEAAERTGDPEARSAQLTFVIVGAGPTGVELAGAIGEMANRTLRNEFRKIDPACARIFIIEGADRVLPQYPPDLSGKAERSLDKLGVSVITNAMVTSVDRRGVDYNKDGRVDRLESRTVLWAAGVQASPLGRVMSERTGTQLDKAGRVIVRPDLTIEGFPEIHVIGDLAAVRDADGEMLPGVAPVAMQQGRYVAGRLTGKIPPSRPFRYRDKGSLAVIGRNAAVAVFDGFRISGIVAWFVWVFVHIAYLIEYDNKILVLTQWAINYFTRKRGSRLITNEAKLPLVGDDE
jgi:NADH dehydrogenase